MARIRSIKPEFWTSEQVAECSPNARLAFIGMWSFCDDSGIHPASTKRLKMEVFPADEFRDSDIKALIGELIASNLIGTYDVLGQSFWRVTGWKHQKIDKPSFKYPLPDGSTPASWKVAGRSANVRRTVVDHSPADVDVDVDVDVEKKEPAPALPSLQTQDREEAFTIDAWVQYVMVECGFAGRDIREVVHQVIHREVKKVGTGPKDTAYSMIAAWKLYDPLEITFKKEAKAFFGSGMWRKSAEQWTGQPKKVKAVNPAEAAQREIESLQ